jgi:hypothetical protein
MIGRTMTILKYEVKTTRFFMISKFILQSVEIYLAEWSVRLQWLEERQSVEPLRKY